MKMLKQVALVSQSPSVALAEVVKVSAAIQKQAMRDFAPIWDTGATVDAFESLSDVPLGYWPVIVRDDVSQQFSGAGGIHLDESGQPTGIRHLESAHGDDKSPENARAERLQEVIRRGPRAPKSPHEYVQGGHQACALQRPLPRTA